MTELERILGPKLAREFAWAALCAMGRAVVFLVAAALLVVSVACP